MTEAMPATPTVAVMQERIEHLVSIFSAWGDEREALTYRVEELEREVDQLRRAHAAISDMARRWAGPELCPVEAAR